MVEDLPSQGDAAAHERRVRNLLAELQRLTGLESAYLTQVDTARGTQHITHSRNTGTLEVPEGLTVPWSDTVCRRALEQGVNHTDDVPSAFPDSEAASQLGLQTYVSVPVNSPDGDLAGTLWRASRSRVPLGDDTLRVMERFALLISEGNRF